MDLPSLDGFAGLASLVNSLLLWPVIRALKNTTQSHNQRIAVLERKRRRKKK